MLGMARKAGLLSIGDKAVEESCDYNKAFAVFVSVDAAENTKRRAKYYVERSGLEYAELPVTKEEAAHAIGRSTCAVREINDAVMGDALMRILLDYDPTLNEAVLRLSEKAEKKKNKAIKPAKKKGESI